MQYLNVRWLIWLPILCLGCVTQKNIRQDIYETGQTAYHDWKAKDEASRLDDQDTLTVQGQAEENTEPMLEGDLTLIDAIKLSLQYNRNLQIELEERLAARGQMLSAFGAAAPSVQVDGGFTRDEDVSGFIIDGEPITSGVLDQYSATLRVEQPLFTGGGLFSGVRAAKYFKALSEQNIQAVLENTLYEAISGYYEVLLLQEELEVAEALLELNKHLFQDVKNNREVGLATEFNVLVAQVELSNAETARISAQNRFDQAMASYLRTLGVSQNSEVALVDRLEFNPIETNRSEAIQLALTHRPELAAAKINVGLQKEVLRGSYSNYFPDVTAFFDNTWGRPLPFAQGEDRWGRLWSAGLSFSWDIFNLGREGQIQQERAALRQQQIAFYDTQEEILFEVQSAFLALENARQSVETQQLTLEQANEGLRQARFGLREGTLKQVEVQEAQQTFSDARLSYFNSLYNYEIARLDLQRATGQLRMQNGIDDRIPDDKPDTN